MKSLSWPEDIDLCGTCYALVPKAAKGDHEQWHATIAEVAIRTANRLDRLTRT